MNALEADPPDAALAAGVRALHRLPPVFRAALVDTPGMTSARLAALARDEPTRWMVARLLGDARLTVADRSRVAEHFADRLAVLWQAPWSTLDRYEVLETAVAASADGPLEPETRVRLLGNLHVPAHARVELLGPDLPAAVFWPWLSALAAEPGGTSLIWAQLLPRLAPEGRAVGAWVDGPAALARVLERVWAHAPLAARRWALAVLPGLDRQRDRETLTLLLHAPDRSVRTQALEQVARRPAPPGPAGAAHSRLPVALGYPASEAVRAERAPGPRRRP